MDFIFSFSLGRLFQCDVSDLRIILEKEVNMKLSTILHFDHVYKICTKITASFLLSLLLSLSSCLSFYANQRYSKIQIARKIIGSRVSRDVSGHPVHTKCHELAVNY